MLPILRILPVGGVLLAILILVLALSPPDASRSPLTATIVPARGALVDRERHPEMRQFLIHAALKRADELNRLRELADTPARAKDVPGAKVAGLPGNRSDAEPDDTGPIGESPSVSIPIEIGERSSTELPVQEESGPIVKTSEPSKPRRRIVNRTRRTRVSAPVASETFLFGFWFSANQSTQPYGTYQTNQTFTGNQTSQPYGVNQSGQSYGTRQANQSAASYINLAPRTYPY
ncbi:MAG TPA: hypothetical protein VEH78_04920 [Pseudolabrys sp.]|nr:hypothetical protein [Pseudolabrys sp.]